MGRGIEIDVESPIHPERQCLRAARFQLALHDTNVFQMLFYSPLDLPRLIGCKLHLGTRQLFSSDNKPLDRYLEQDFFDRIIVLVRRKFPDMVLPLSV
jgi:hypothetical protein